jgi:hypothetical protein
MAANPIGLLVVAIAALIAGVVALTSYFMSNAKANRENAKAVEENTKALKKQQEANKTANDELLRGQAYQLAMARANGASTKAIRALELKLIDEKIATEQLSRETANNTLIKNVNALATLRQTGASDALIKKQEEVVIESTKFANEQTANLRKSLTDRVELQRKHNVEVAAETTAANNNAAQKRKQQSDQALADQKKANDERIAQEKKNAEDLAKFQEDLRKQRAKDLKTDEEETAKLFAKQEEKEEEDRLARIEQEKEFTAIALKAREDDLAAKKKKADEEKALDDSVFANKQRNLAATTGLLRSVSELVGKETAAGKALAVASSLIDTYASITSTIRAAARTPAGGIPGYAIAQGIAVGIAGLAAVRNILKVKVPNSSSSSSGGVGSVPTTPIAAPVAPQAETTRLDQGQINQIGNAAGRAFVVESDITGNQEKIRRLNRQARIN